MKSGFSFLLKQYSYILWLFLFFFVNVNAQSIYFSPAFSSSQNALHIALEDAKQWMGKANAIITEDSSQAQLQFYFYHKAPASLGKTRYQQRSKEADAFFLQIKTDSQHTKIYLEASSYKGLANGVYYVLQDYLGFQFYHPKETRVPDRISWRLPAIEEHVQPRFHKMGFHIHAMHPLEITEALLNENTPNGAQEVQTYIDWLCRNGQNYFEFNLLSSIQLDTWIPYMRSIIDYAHDRDVLMGADLSMNMIQQRAFQLYKGAPHTFENKKKQIVDNIAALTQLDFDVWNVEMATTEFTHKNQEKLYLQQRFLYEQLQAKNIEITGRKHVVKDDQLISSEKSIKTQRTDMDSAYGILVHTVMFYGLLDEKTPVYRNDNFEHLRQLLIESKDYRETWYFPESAYWITFDNSVPMFLTSYLNARLADILYCDSLGIAGHLTFSSGWEWNYWLIDWSIARWCWNSNRKPFPKPDDFIKAIAPNASFLHFAQVVMDLQETYIKQKELIKVLTAQTVTDEIPGKLNLEFHPRPEFSYKYMRNEATEEELNFLEQKYVLVLHEFIAKYQAARQQIQGELSPLEKELLLSLDLTAMRAEHRFYTLQYLFAIRRKQAASRYLEQAQAVRFKALKMVKEQEKNYRYPLELLAGKRPSKTVYNFGYLYPTTELHFWEREELQAKNNHWNFWYRSIWDVFKIIGVKG